jgi:hypothetical protein
MCFDKKKNHTHKKKENFRCKLTKTRHAYFFSLVFTRKNEPDKKKKKSIDEVY